ncbi:MAG TPA: YbaB/EbfC family nucleoid-associated protein [Aquimonas sp.]|jgi:nucleoid-associated protein EbfC|nr:YbaB/EbfC family nucleoid-associated protein [Xanthomonadales bacterium]HRD72586.1 YbaB/EbfC family nucleoid-associated protein [Aquimonas sp.]HRF55401.1 YbaB/EbfC family nucleoid-associated protein [Aquimonas sp.]
MRGPLAGLMQQAQKMQDNLKKAQEELAHIEVSGQSGGGLVKITMTARMDLRRVQIDPQAISDDIEMLEDLITAAFNDAIARANEASQAKMGAVTAGVPLPPGMKLPF